MSESKIQYNRAKNWEVVLFATKDVVPNVFLFLMNFVSYLATGNYGILVSVAGIIVTASRIFDGITDPIIGLVVDKTNGRFGRFRPMMVIGYIIIAISLFLMYFVGIGSGVVVFTIIYAVYIIGYTFFTTASNGARSVLTNEPKQRASNGRWTGIFVILLSTAFSSVYTSKYLIPKHSGVNLAALQEMCITAIIIGGVFTILACIAIASKDKPEYYSNLSSSSVSLKDIFTTLKGNRPLQMMIVAASSDKLAMQTTANSSVGIMVFGIIVGNYTFRSNLSLWVLIPTILMIFFGMSFASKLGFKKATVFSAWGAIITSIIQFLLFRIAPTQIGVNIGVTALFIISYSLTSGFKQIGTSCVPPMMSDIADYEMYRTGKFIPGMVSAVYSFVDKVISSLAATIVALLLSMIGFTDVLPQPSDAYTEPIFWLSMFIFIGMPLIGWLCTIVAMKYYTLDPEKMKEIQMTNAERKAADKAV